MNRKLKISLYLAAIFVAGVVTGMFVSFEVVRHMMPRPEKMAARWCGELQSKLHLTPEQLRKIRPIIDDTLGQFRTSMTGVMYANLSNCNARIALEITPEQRPKFEQIQKEQQEFIRTKVGGGTPGSPKKP
jgi:Spy/CpxP family protein refolding chaperone